MKLLNQFATFTIQNGTAKDEMCRVFRLTVAERAESLFSLDLLHSSFFNGKTQTAGAEFKAEARQSRRQLEVSCALQPPIFELGAQV